MPRILLLDNQLLRITIDRLCHELVEKHEDFGASVILGMQPRGRFLADRIHARLNYLFGTELPIGYLDTTFYRDDFRRRAEPLKASVNHVPFLIEGKNWLMMCFLRAEPFGRHFRQWQNLADRKVWNW